MKGTPKTGERWDPAVLVWGHDWPYKQSPPPRFSTSNLLLLHQRVYA